MGLFMDSSVLMETASNPGFVSREGFFRTDPGNLGPNNVYSAEGAHLVRKNNI